MPLSYRNVPLLLQKKKKKKKNPSRWYLNWLMGREMKTCLLERFVLEEQQLADVLPPVTCCFPYCHLANSNSTYIDLEGYIPAI